MLLLDDTRASLPAALTDATVTHHAGLRRVRLFRVAGQRGAELLEHATWSLETPLGEPPGFGESPTEEPEGIAQTVYERALDALASGGKDRRFRVELTTATEDGEKTEAVGFQVDGARAAETRGMTAEAATGRTMAELTNYIGALHRQNVMLLEGANKGMRVVFGMLPNLVSERIAAAEDRIEATLERAGVERPSSSDDSWKSDTIHGIHDLLKTVAPQLFPQAPDVPKDSLRGKLRELGGSLSKEQQSKLASLVGLELGMKLRKAGEADTEEKAAALLADFVSKVDPEKLAELLEEKQREILAGIFDALEKIVDAAEKKSTASS